MSRRGFEDWRFTGDPAPLAHDNIVACQGDGVSSKTRRRGTDKTRSLNPLVRLKGGRFLLWSALAHIRV